MALIHCPECKNKVSETANSCPKCGWQITPEKAPKTKAKEKALWLNIAVVVVALLWFFGSMQSRSDKPKEQDAIKTVQKFYAPGNNLQLLMAGRNWRDDGDWFATRWSFGVSDEMKRAGMTDMWEVTYKVTLMDGLQEKTIKAEWGVDLKTKAHSALNATAKTLFIGF